MSKTDIANADMGDIHRLEQKIEKLKEVISIMICRLPVELGHATAEELIEEIDNI